MISRSTTQMQGSNIISGPPATLTDGEKNEMAKTMSTETNNNAMLLKQPQPDQTGTDELIKLAGDDTATSLPNHPPSSVSSGEAGAETREAPQVTGDAAGRREVNSGSSYQLAASSSLVRAQRQQGEEGDEDEAAASGKQKSPSSSSSFTVIECGKQEQQKRAPTTTTTTTAASNDSNDNKQQQLVPAGEPIALEPVKSQLKSKLNLSTIITSNNNQQDQLDLKEPNNTTSSEQPAKNLAGFAEKFTSSSSSAKQHFSHHQNDGASSTSKAKLSASQLNPNNRLHRLSYLQSLLLRRWPWLALSICAMSSLIFAIILSALTVYFMHGVTDCSGLAALHAGAQTRPLSLEPETAALLEGGGAAAFEGRHLGPAGGQPQVGSGSASISPTLEQSRAKFEQLPRSVWPSHYELFVQPFISEPDFNFSARVQIYLSVSEPTRRIQLHALDLNVEESQVALLALDKVSNNSTNNNNNAAATPIKVASVSHDKQLQYLVVELARELQVGQEYLLKINFTGHLNDDLAGFYRIKYERHDTNEITWIAATQFQATDARRAFPCFDEPLYKATFSIQIKHWKNMTALSNMPIIDRKDSSDGLWVTDTFSKSQRMSTYLVAYAVTNFESRSLGNISVWTRPGFTHTAQYALETASKVLNYYEDFFGIEYPLPKMDMIALQDFNAGAMENWGLITYRETAMLYDENSSSLGNKQRVATVVAHELAHQWFGNLVTPKWWDDLWLNEGFASYVEYIGVDHIEPKWRMLDQFVLDELQNVLRMDALPSTHQISIPVNNPDEISEIFDHISYAKGASIIRMMSHFLTEPIFKSGLRRYLRALKYDNAEQSDLWRHLTEAQQLAGLDAQKAVDVEHVMNSWTLQTGFPLVTLTRRYDNSRRASLKQVRYQPHKIAANSSNIMLVAVTHEDNQKWEIPLTYTWKSELNWEPTTRLWMHQNQSESSLETPNTSDDDWILLNVGQVGYYRVNYDQRNWKLLIEQLNQDHLKISPINRAQILDDLFDLAKCGAIDYRFAMEATKFLRAEKDYMPWDVVLLAFSYIDDMLTRTPIYGEFKDYLLDLMAPYYARYKDLEWTMSKDQNGTSASLSNDVPEHYNMMNAIAWACQIDKHCIDRAKAHFARWKMSSQNDIKPALRYTIYCAAIENGDKDDWEFLWKKYEREQNASERDRIMRALGCSKEMWILSRYLEWTFSKTSKSIRRQDGATVFRMIARNNYGRDLAFNFMRERWVTIKEYYGKTSFSLSNLIRSISGSMNTQVELNQLVSFYENIKNDIGNGKRSFQIAIEEVESNVNWRNKNYKVIESWLQEARPLKKQ